MTRSLPRRVAALALVVLIVSSSVAAPVAASTASSTNAVDAPTALFGSPDQEYCGMYRMLVNLALGEAECGVDTTSEVQNATSEDNQTALQLYEAGLAQKAQTENFQTVSNNYLNDTQAVAWSKAEIAIAKAYQNGSSESVAESRARTAIADYYSRIQRNQIEAWNASVVGYSLIADRAANESGVSQIVFLSDEYDNHHNLSLRTQSITLANDSIANVSGYRVEGSTGTTAATPAYGVQYQSHTQTRIVIESVDSNHPGQDLFIRSRWADRWQQSQDLNTQLQDEATNYTAQVYDGLDSGAVNASDITSRTTKMFELAAGSSTDGQVGLYRSVALYASMGLATPDLEGLGTMEVSHDGTTDYGILLAERAPDGTWRANTTYETPGTTAPAINVSGPVRLATTGGDVKTLTGTFTVGNITDTNGDPLATVSAERRSYQTADVSGLLAKMNETQQLIAQIESRQATGGTGTGSGSGGSGPLIIVGLAVVAIGAAAVMQRD